MNRKIYTLLLISAVVLTASAQRNVGMFSITPKLGVSLGNLTNNDLQALQGESCSSKFKAGFTAGVEGEYMVLDNLGFSLGAFFTSQGFKYSDYSVPGESSEGNKLPFIGFSRHSLALGYVQMPLLANVYVAPGLAFKAGLQAGFMVSSTLEYEERPFTKDPDTGAYEYGETVKYKNTDTDWLNKVDVSIPVGMSYEYMNVVLDARYNIGLTKVTKAFDSKNKCFTFTVGYRFAL